MPQEPNPDVHAHEARISRLEDHVSELQTGQVAVQGDLKLLGQQLAGGIAQISERIDLSIRPLADTLASHIKEDTLSRTKIEQIDEVVGGLETARRAQESRRAAWYWTLKTIAFGAGAILFKELVVLIVHAFRP